MLPGLRVHAHMVVVLGLQMNCTCCLNVQPSNQIDSSPSGCFLGINIFLFAQ